MRRAAVAGRTARGVLALVLAAGVLACQPPGSGSGERGAGFGGVLRGTDPAPWTVVRL